MKTLHKNLAGIDRQFVWVDEPEGTAKSVELALIALEAKKDTTKKLKDLIDEKGDFNDALGKARKELNAYRKALLSGKAEPDPGLSEDFVSNVIKNTVQYSDSNTLEAALGLKMSISPLVDTNKDGKINELDDKIIDNDGIDKDTNLDLDEFVESQQFVKDYENLEVIIDELIKESPNLPNNDENDKFLLSLTNIKTRVSPKIEELKRGSLSNPEKEQIESDIEDILTSEVTNGFDIGLMLENFADLARRNGKSGEIDSAIEEFVETSKPGPSLEFQNAAPGSMEELIMENKELTSFLAEYYPPRDFEKDLETYKKENGVDISKIKDKNEFKKEISNFFWVMNLDGKSIKEQLKLYRVDDAFEKLKEAIIIDENRSVESSSPLKTASMYFANIWSSVNSNMPSYFRHFEFGEEDVKNAKNIEELFKNKLEQSLSGNKINLASLKNLTRKLSVENDPSIIKGLEKTIPKLYRGGDIAKRYREDLENGDTRQDFESWLNSKDVFSGEEKVSTMQKLGNFLKFFGRWFMQAKIWLGFASEEEKAEFEKKKEEIENGDPDFKEKIETAIGDQEVANEKENNKKKWLSQKTGTPEQKANWQAFIDFHKDNFELFNFINPITETDLASHNNNPDEYRDLPESFGETSPKNFKTKWNNEESQGILKWARSAIHDPISQKTWKKVIENKDKLKVDESTNPPELKYVQPAVYGMDSSRSITRWNNSEIEKLLKPNARIKEFEKLKEDNVLSEDFTAGTFFTDHADELFVNPKSEETKFRPFFAGLFGAGLKNFRKEPITMVDFEAILANEKNLVDGFDAEIKTNQEDNDYYMYDSGELKEVEDGIIKGTNDQKANNGEDQKTFEVDIAGVRSGNWTDWYQDFTSVKALIEKLKIGA